MNGAESILPELESFVTAAETRDPQGSQWGTSGSEWACPDLTLFERPGETQESDEVGLPKWDSEINCTEVERLGSPQEIRATGEATPSASELGMTCPDLEIFARPGEGQVGEAASPSVWGSELACEEVEIFGRPAENQFQGLSESAAGDSDSILEELVRFDNPVEMAGQVRPERCTSHAPESASCRVYGFDPGRGEFSEDLSPRIVTGTGAFLSLQHEVYADDILRIVNRETYFEADFRVVGPTKMDGTRVAEWAVESLQKNRSIWNEGSPPLSGQLSEMDGGITLQCRACNHEIQHAATRMESESLDSTGIIAIYCDHCDKATYWTFAEPSRRPMAFPPFPALAPPPRVERVKKLVNTRAHRRLKLDLSILVRDQHGKEVVARTENVSVGGFAVILSLDLAVGEKLTYICPYATGGQQIEQQAECRWSAPTSPGGVQKIYGFRRI